MAKNEKKMYDYRDYGNVVSQQNPLTINAKDIGMSKTMDALVKDYTVATTKAGSSFISGTFENKGATVPFKVWGTAEVAYFQKKEPINTVLNVTTVMKEYNGSFEYHITSINSVSNIDPNVFKKSVDVDALFNEFCTYIRDNISKPWVDVINLAFSALDGVDMYSLFKVGYSGSAMHDAQVGGLMNHTLKMLKVYDTLESNDSRIEPMGDLIRVGIILHDIGKIEEMVDGVYQPNSFIHHLIIGATYLGRYRKEITALIGEDNYFRLVSIITGHHGGLGGETEPTTIYAYIVHLVDMVDSQTTAILDQLSNYHGMRKSSTGVPTWTHNDIRMSV